MKDTVLLTGQYWPVFLYLLFAFFWSLHTIFAMKHISLRIPRYEIDGTQILGDISLLFNASDRIAVVGPNGAGKSTLMKVITGEIEVPDAVFENTGYISLGYLSQIHFDTEDMLVKEELRFAFSDILKLESALEIAESEMESPG